MITNTDAVLWYNVGIFGEAGYGVPNPSDDVGSLNYNIVDIVNLMGRNLFHIMHHEDVDLRTPPSINTLRRVHKLYVRAGAILNGRAVPYGENNMEVQHVQPGGEVFLVYPVPYFRVRNPFLKRWSGWILVALAEAMQHTENRKALEISPSFAGQIGQYIRRVYVNMAIELFGIDRDAAHADGFLLTNEQLAGYDPSQFFTSTELVDTVPRLDRVFTEDRLKVLAEGIPVTSLPKLQPWPTNLTSHYESIRAGQDNATDHAGKSSSGSRSGGVVPPAPGP